MKPKQQSFAFEKYQIYRGNVLPGDIILVRSNRPLAKAIQKIDDAYYTHAMVVFGIAGRKLIVDATGEGDKPNFLSYKMKEYDDFCIIRINDLSYAQVKEGIGVIMRRAETSKGYDRSLMIRIAIQKKFGIDLTGLGDPNRDICSMFARKVTAYHHVYCYSPENLKSPWITPQDFIRFADPSEVTILLHNPKQ